MGYCPACGNVFLRLKIRVNAFFNVLESVEPHFIPNCLGTHFGSGRQTV